MKFFITLAGLVVLGAALILVGSLQATHVSWRAAGSTSAPANMVIPAGGGYMPNLESLKNGSVGIVALWSTPPGTNESYLHVQAFLLLTSNANAGVYTSLNDALPLPFNSTLPGSANLTLSVTNDDPYKSMAFALVNAGPAPITVSSFNATLEVGQVYATQAYAGAGWLVYVGTAVVAAALVAGAFLWRKHPLPESSPSSPP